LSAANLNANLGSPYFWLKDSDSLVIKALPKNRPALLDATKDLPTGPITSNAGGSVSQNRTFPDLLKNQNDETNFVNIASSELIKVSLNGKTSSFMPADMYVSESLSPDGKLLLLSTIQNRFLMSYLTTVSLANPWLQT